MVGHPPCCLSSYLSLNAVHLDALSTCLRFHPETGIIPPASRINLMYKTRTKNSLRVAGLALLALMPGPYATSQTATTTSLTVTSGGSEVSTAAAGSLVTLTATVQAGATAVTRGEVNFCDGAAIHCTDVHIVGTAQLTNAGAATFYLRPSPGSYSYRAEFIGTFGTAVPYAGSASSVSVLDVTGKLPTASVIAQGGSSGDYSLTASLFGFSRSNNEPAPTGTVSFLDTTLGNSVLGTATLASLSTGPVLVNVSNPAIGNEPGSVVAADFNGDGYLDFVVGLDANVEDKLAIFLGDGTGNFLPAGGSPVSVNGAPTLTADFNDDGIPDLLITDSAPPGESSFSVLLGNGDGTFAVAPGSPFYTNYGVSPVAVGDFNGDGILDIAAAGGYYLITLLGKGDGSFTEIIGSGPAGLEANLFSSMIPGDFNDDGIVDLAIIDTYDENVIILIGQGNGKFTQGSTIPISTTSAGTFVNLVSADFNEDGKPDLAIPIDAQSGTLAVLLGNGDGTFQPAGTSSVPFSWTSSVTVGDFNGDGIPDLFTKAASSVTDASILLGNGDGTFVETKAAAPYLQCCTSVLGDFNGDGVTDVVNSSFYDGLAKVYLTGLKQSSAMVNGISVTGVTPQAASASYPGDSVYAGSDSAPALLLVQAAAPAFTPAAGTIELFQPIAISSPTPGATIFYQLSGVMQTSGYQTYFAPLVVTVPGTLTIEAYTTAFNYGDSNISSATYIIVVPNPLPTITSISPAFTGAGGSDFMLTISGSGFVSGSVVYWGTGALTTQYSNVGQLTAKVTADEIAAMGTANVTVQSPVPGGGTSNVMQFEIDSGASGASPSFTPTMATVTAGSSASYAVTLPASATNVTASCLNLPSGATCSYSASSGVLTIATAASTPAGSYQITAVFGETLPASKSAVTSMAMLALSFVVAGSWIVAQKANKRVLGTAFLSLALMVCLVGCGGGGSDGGSPPPPATEHVTASGVVALTVR